MTEWIKFVEVNLHDGRKTRVWAVLTTDGKANLGAVSWYSSWRRYSFSPNPSTTFEWDCLRTIANFCEQQTKVYKAQRQALRF